MSRLAFAWVLTLLTVASTTLVTAQSNVPAGTACSETRIRRPWENYTDAERTLYINAVSLAISKGHQQKFVELHTEWFSEKEAHQNCMFMYWHRMYLLGYENMLRSLGPEYQCVTIPYWDHLSATARTASESCGSIEACSPIYRDFGGSSVGLSKSIIVYNQTIGRPTGGTCVNRAMLSNFCGNTSTCARCVVRGTAYKTVYPSEAFFPSVYQQVFTYSSWGNFALSIERGVHNTVHSAISGAMAFLQSPIDPIFYTHHAFIDALQSIYFKCNVGDENARLTAEQKGSDLRFWGNCGRRTGGSFSSNDTITMNTRSFDGQWVSVRENPQNTLYPFFKDLPPRFSDYIDAKDLGVYSYTYLYQGALTNMYINCNASNTVAATNVTGSQPAGTTTSLLAQTGVEGKDKRSDDLAPITHAPNQYDTKIRRWSIAMFEAAKLSGYSDEAARDQMEMIMCVYKYRCLGGVADYDPVFRANFKITGHPRCYTIIKELESGDRVIGIPKWRQLTKQFFQCKKKTTMATQLMEIQVQEASALEL